MWGYYQPPTAPLRLRADSSSRTTQAPNASSGNVNVPLRDVVTPFPRTPRRVGQQSSSSRIDPSEQVSISDQSKLTRREHITPPPVESPNTLQARIVMQDVQNMLRQEMATSTRYINGHNTRDILSVLLRKCQALLLDNLKPSPAVEYARALWGPQANAQR